MAAPSRDFSYLVPKITLRPGPVAFTPRHYYLLAIEDSTGTDSTGFSLLPGTYKKKKIVFDGNKETILTKYLKSIIATNTSLYPVVLRFKTFHISEKQLSKAEVEQTLNTTIEVFCRINNELVSLHKAETGFKAAGYIGSKRIYDSLTRDFFKELAETIDKIMEAAAKHDKAFIKGVRLKTTIQSSRAGNEDTLIIEPPAYLDWSDFRGEVIHENRCNSSVNIVMQDERKRLDNYVDIQMTIYPVMVRKKSWAGANGRVSKALNYEQYKCLLTYLHALKLKKELDQASFTIDNYEEKAGEIFRKVIDEFELLLQKYSYETLNGSKPTEQSAWQTRIENEIAELKKTIQF